MSAINFDALRCEKTDRRFYAGSNTGGEALRDFGEELRKLSGDTSDPGASRVSARDTSAGNAKEKVLQYQEDLERELLLRSKDPSRGRREEEEEHVLFENKQNSAFESKTLAELAGMKPDKEKDKEADEEEETIVKQTRYAGQNVKSGTHIIYMKTDDMLYSGGNGTGLSFYIKYAENSTEEDPMVVAKGVDENGDEFQQLIHINQIDPRNATIVEMRALEAYIGVEKQYGFTSLPLDTGNMRLHDRRNFMEMFADVIGDMGLLRQRKTADYYRYSMQAYLDFMNKKLSSRGGN